jgi:hypothetical protein
VEEIISICPIQFIIMMEEAQWKGRNEMEKKRRAGPGLRIEEMGKDHGQKTMHILACAIAHGRLCLPLNEVNKQQESLIFPPQNRSQVSSKAFVSE